MIKLIDIEKVYHSETIETVALNKVNITVNKGEFIAIMGPSGCGKSTLLNVMGLLDEPTSGKVEIDGQLITSYSDTNLSDIRNHKLGFIFQGFHLINELTVVDNVALPLLYRKGLHSSEKKKMALAALDKVGLSARTRHFPNQLSGGQRQRVAIARAIVGNPNIILADEPTGNLDSATGYEVLNLLIALNQKYGATIVMVTHDESMAKRAKRIIRFFDGRQVS